MAGSSASGRSPPPDGRATGKSGLGPLEALWKHKAEKRCAIPTDRAKWSLALGIGKCRKLRKNSRFRVIVHGSFGTTHNLKVAGSNPAPATKPPENTPSTRAILLGGHRDRDVMQTSRSPNHARNRHITKTNDPARGTVRPGNPLVGPPAVNYSVSRLIVLYPAALKKLQHSSSLNRLQTCPTACHCSS